MSEFFTEADCDRLAEHIPNEDCWIQKLNADFEHAAGIRSFDRVISIEKANRLLAERGKVVRGDEENGWVQENHWGEWDNDYSALIINIQPIEAEDSAEDILRDFVIRYANLKPEDLADLFERACLRASVGGVMTAKNMQGITKEAYDAAIKERDEALRRIAIMESQASQFASTLAETVKQRDEEIERLRSQFGFRLREQVTVFELQSSILTECEQTLKFYAENANWPYASKGCYPGERARQTLAKIAEWRSK